MHLLAAAVTKTVPILGPAATTHPRGEPRTSRYLRRSYSTGFADALARPLARKVTPASFKRARTSAPPPDPDELPPAARCDLATEVGQSLESLKWFLWHGNVFRALQTIEDLECQLDEGGEEATFEQVRLVKAVREFDTYIRANADRIPN